MQKKLFISVVGIVVAFFLLTQILGYFARSPQGFFKIADGVMQSELESELKRRNITFARDEGGGVSFDASNQELVAKIAKGVMERGAPVETSISYVDVKYTDLLEQKLILHGVYYKIEKVDGRKHIVLKYSDSQKWEPLKREVDALFQVQTRSRLNNN